MMAKTGPKPTDPVQRFWRKVDVRSREECWEWQGSRLVTGYGQFGLSRSRPAKKETAE